MFSVPPFTKVVAPAAALADGDALFPLFDALEHAVTSSPIAEIAASNRTDPLIPTPPVERRRPPSPRWLRRALSPFAVSSLSSPSSHGYASATREDRGRRACRPRPG